MHKPRFIAKMRCWQLGLCGFLSLTQRFTVRAKTDVPRYLVWYILEHVFSCSSVEFSTSTELRRLKSGERKNLLLAKVGLISLFVVCFPQKETGGRNLGTIRCYFPLLAVVFYSTFRLQCKVQLFLLLTTLTKSERAFQDYFV